MGEPTGQAVLAFDGGLPRRLLRATPSRLASFADCPRRYRMTYLDRPAPSAGPPSAHNTLGAAVHLVFKRLYDLPGRRRTPTSAASLLDAAWRHEGFRDEAQSGRWRCAARGWVEGYVAATDMEREPRGVERTVALRTRGMALSGRIDRLDERDDGTLVVVDYKTGRRPLTDDDARTASALALYALAAAGTLRQPCVDVELHHLRDVAVLRHHHTQESLARHLERAEDIAEDIVVAEDTLAAGGPADALFPPAPSALCRWCDLRAHCPEGQAMGAAAQPWAGLGDDE